MACPRHPDIPEDQHELLAALATQFGDLTVEDRIDVFQGITCEAVSQYLALTITVLGDEAANKIRAAIGAL